MKNTLLVIVVLAASFGIYWFATYNSLVSANEAVNNHWAQVETQYQRRFDLIPNFVEFVKGVMQQEQTILLPLPMRAHGMPERQQLMKKRQQPEKSSRFSDACLSLWKIILN